MSFRGRWGLAWLPAFAYMALIWVLSSMPLAVSIEGVPFKDKGIHFVEYATLALLLCHAVYRGLPKQAVGWAMFYGFVGTTLWGLLDEIHQAYVPGRNADPLDVLADTLGAVLGVLLYALHRFVRGRRHRTPVSSVD